MDQLDVFLINLDIDVRRLEWMVRALDGFGIAFSRVSAVDGSDLNDEQSTYHQNERRKHLSTAEIGCVLSHIEVWKKIANGSKPYGLVLEDDVHFAPGFDSFLRNLLAAVPRDGLWIHRFETFHARTTLDRAPAFTIGQRKAFALHTNHAGAAAYLISQDMARHCLSCVSTFSHLPDTELFDPDRRTITGHTCYQWLPAPCIQDMQLDFAEGLASNLADDRSDERGVNLQNRPVRDRVKDLLRPAYTRAYSSLLALKGRQRRSIPFG